MGGHEGACCPGWFRNGETNEIERCDACAVFETDEDAIRHVGGENFQKDKAAGAFFCQTEGHETYRAVVKIPLMDRAAPGDDFDYYCFECACRFGHVCVEYIGSAMAVDLYREVATKHGTFVVGDTVRATTWYGRDLRIASLYQYASGAWNVMLEDTAGAKGFCRETQLRKLDTEVKLRVHFDACEDHCCRVCRGVEPDADTTLAALLDTATNGLELSPEDIPDLRALGVGQSCLIAGLRTAQCRVERIA